MRILELTVENIRGIKKLNIKLDGNNAVIFGQNGTGKSAVVDAIDFLLTGDITRLSGKGCGYLKLSEHGCHVDSREHLKDTIVRAKIKIDDKEIVVERSIQKPKSYKVIPSSEKEFIAPYFKIAELGQHLLSRREILRYITSEAGERAKEIQSLLNLSNIENLRSILVSVRNNAESQHKNAESNLGLAESAIKNILSLQSFSKQQVLDKINEKRHILGGKPIDDVSANDIKKDIVSQLFGGHESDLTMDQLENTAKELRNIISGEITIVDEGEEKKVKHKEYLTEKQNELIGLMDEVKQEAKIKEYSLYKKLFEIGASLIDESNMCPLCGREWEGGDFKQYLASKQEQNEVAKEKLKGVDELSSYLKQHIDLIAKDFDVLFKACQKFKETEYDRQGHDKLKTLCEKWSASMLDPLTVYETEKWPKQDIRKMLESEVLIKIIEIVDQIVKDMGAKYSQQQLAWDALTKMEEAWGRYVESEKDSRKHEKSKNRSDLLLEYFQEARDAMLDGIYEEIKGNFESYYKAIHSEDEAGFSSEIKHKEAELIVEVDFYGRGKFPPHAVHSEGHQDSMGLCLFFALNRYLASDLINVVVLDDVVMSIDRNHRRSICSMLKKYFMDKQLIITTHETAWAKQLRSEGLVNADNMYHFVNWNIETGPIIEMEKDLWAKIDEDLAKDDVPSAAQKLRRNAESFFENMCDLLESKIVYKGHHRWDLGDYADSAVSAYKKYLSRAINNAKKANDLAKQGELEEIEKKANEIIQKTNIERWAVNEEVHYNKWSEMAKNDFLPVINAFKDLFGLFTCSCGSTISIMEGVGEDKRKIVACKCGKVFWDVQ